MAKDKIRVAIIGNGIIGESHIQTYLKIPEAEIAAICDINEARLTEIGDRYHIDRRYTHIGKMLRDEELDAVDVCLHNNMHAPVSIAVMRSGRDCYCEKPMAGSFYDAREMLRVSEETGRKLHIQLAFLYSNETKAAKRYIDAGDLGRIYHMRSYGFRRRGRPYVDGYAAKEFVNTATSGGGALFDMGVYHISQLLYLTGIPELERVTGRTYAEVDAARGLAQATAIPSGGDLNDCMDAGLYCCASTAVAGTLSNSPCGSAFTLFVTSLDNTGARLQEITSLNENWKRVRYHGSGGTFGWTAWAGGKNESAWPVLTIPANGSVSFTLSSTYTMALLFTTGYSVSVMGAYSVARSGQFFIKKDLTAASDITVTSDTDGVVTVANGHSNPAYITLKTILGTVSV